MWPKDLEAIYSKLHNLNTEHGFPENARPFIYQEVIGDPGAVSTKEYDGMAAVTEFKYGYEISNAVRGNNPLKWLVNWGEKWGMLPSGHALVFVDNHDTQRSGGRVLTYKDSKLYKVFGNVLNRVAPIFQNHILLVLTPSFVLRAMVNFALATSNDEMAKMLY